MKRNLLLSFTLFALSLCTTSFAQTNYTWTWTGAVDNNYNTAANWNISPAADANTSAMGYPRNLSGNTSVVVFNSSASIELPNVTSFFINEIRVMGGTVSITKSTIGNTEIGFEGVGLNISSGARLNVVCDAQGIKLLMNASANNCTIAGTLDLTGSGSSSAPPKLEKANFVNPVWTVASGGKIILSGLNAQFLSTTPATLKFQSGSSLDITRNGGTISPADYQAGSTINVLGCTSTCTQFSNSYDNFLCDINWNCPSQTVTTFSAQWSLSSALPSNFKGKFTMKAGYLRMIGTGLNTEMLGALDIQGGTLEFGYSSGTALPTVLGNVNVSGGNLRVSSSDFTGGVTLTVNGNVTQTGGTINLAPGSGVGILNVKGDVTQTAGTLTESGTSTTSALAFKGTSIQNATFSGTLSGDKLIIITNNGGNHVNLLADAVLPYRLQCTSGNVILGTKNLTVTEKVFGSRTGGHVVTNGTGTLTLKAVDNISGKDFPIGSSNASHDAVYITNTTGTADFTVRVGATVSPAVSISMFTALPRQWEITSSSAAANLEFDPDPSAGTQLATKTIARYTGSAWMPAISAIGANQGYPYSADFTAFSSFIVGSVAAIPVELVKFGAKAKDKTNILEWTTATERNVSHFDIERSANGLNGWQSIATLKPKGTTQGAANYELVDEGPLSISYYRLTSVDNDGTKEASKIVSVNRSGKSLKINSLSPIPATLETLTLDLQSDNGEITISLMDITGKIVQTEKKTVSEGRNTIAYPLSKIANGVYFLTVFDGKSQIIEKIVKQ
jgi:Secretion system C-terminal sorting domain